MEVTLEITPLVTGLHQLAAPFKGLYQGFEIAAGEIVDGLAFEHGTQLIDVADVVGRVAPDAEAAPWLMLDEADLQKQSLALANGPSARSVFDFEILLPKHLSGPEVAGDDAPAQLLQDAIRNGLRQVAHVCGQICPSSLGLTDISHRVPVLASFR